jgi:hypothetical protein
MRQSHHQPDANQIKTRKTEMSEHLDIRAKLSATDEMSPVLRKVLADIHKLESAAKAFHASFSVIGRTGLESMAGFGRIAQNAAAQMRGVANTSKAASRSYADDWRRATEQRLSESRRMFAQLERMESNYLRQVERRAAAERRTGRNASRVNASRGRFPAPSIGSMMFGGAAIGATAASAIKKRIQVEAAETRAAMFGELSKDEIKNLRRDTDKLGIRYGVGSTAAMDAATEGLKAGIQKQFAGQFAELGLKARAGLDINEADTAKLMGRLTTMHGSFDKPWLNSILNAIAVANNATAADGNEIVEAYRRSLSVLTETKMRTEDLAAFDASAISIGIQPFKAGTYMSFITSELANAKNARGQRGKDLSQASNLLGFAGRAELSNQMIANPTETLLKVYERMMKMPEALRAKVANLIGQREWRDELLSVAAARDLIVKTLSEIVDKKGFLDATSLKKLRSMAGRWATIQAVFSLVWEKVGAGFDKIFDQVSDAFIDIADKFDFDSISQHVSAFIEGLRDGFGFKDWAEAVKSLAGMFDAGSIQKWKDFGQGFAEGLKEIADGFRIAFKALSFVSGGGNDSAKTIGNLAGEITGLAISLAVLAPVMATLAAFVTIIRSVALAFGGSAAARILGSGPVGTTAMMAWLLARNNATGIPSANIKQPGETTSQWRERQQRYRELRRYKPSGDPLFQPSAYYGNTDISGRRRGVVEDLSENLKKFTGKVERAAFIGGSGSGGLQNALFVGGGGGGGSIITASAGLGGRSFIGGVPDPVTGVPGQTLPPFNGGSIIRRDKIPSFAGGGGSVANPGASPSFDPNVGAGLAGNSYLAARRARFKQELDANPELKKRLAALVDLENPGAGTAVVESLMNRMDMNGGTIASGIGGGRKSFYGPVRRGLVDSRMRELERNPARLAARMKQIDAAAAGSNLIHGHTDQGSAGDPNYIVGGVGDNINRERFNDWGGGRWHGLTGHAASRAYREDLMRHVQGATSAPIISQVPTPADAILNVPSPIRGDASLGLLRNGVGGGGPVSININGGSHDPEALATLVQRRIDESMNWRTHDSVSEYT